MTGVHPDQPYTPSEEQVRSHYVFDQSDRWDADRGIAFDRWLASVRRDAQADAWDEGLGAGADRWMDGREFGDKPVNPYRAAAIRRNENGDT